jgi:hypothetical protein
MNFGVFTMQPVGRKTRPLQKPESTAYEIYKFKLLPAPKLSIAKNYCKAKTEGHKMTLEFYTIWCL